MSIRKLTHERYQFFHKISSPDEELLRIKKN